MMPIHIYAPSVSSPNYDASAYCWFTTDSDAIGCCGGGGCTRCNFQDFQPDGGCFYIQSTLYHFLKPASGFTTIAYDDIVANYPEAFL